MRATFWTIAGWIAAAGAIYASESTPVDLVPEYPVYRAGTPGPIKLQIKNTGTKFVVVYGWQVRKGSTWIYGSPPLGQNGFLDPGRSLTIAWDKRRSNGSWVPAGSYRIVAYLRVGNEESRYCSLTVALTSTGKLAGTNPYPLAVGNRWSYRKADGTEWVSQVTASGNGWYYMTKPPAGTGWVILTGTARPVLWVWDGSKAQFLFHFFEPTGATWSTGLLGYKTLRIHAARESVLTPLARFDDSISIRNDPYDTARWFVRGLGMVRDLYYFAWIPYDSRLVGAKIRGSDGSWYTLRSATMTWNPSASPDP